MTKLKNNYLLNYKKNSADKIYINNYIEILDKIIYISIVVV